MSKALTQPPKGSRDFLPSEVRKREHVTDLIRRVYESYGFEPLQTPSFERLQTLTGKYGSEGDRLLFKVLLRGQPLVDGIRRAADHLKEPGGIVRGRSGETAPGAEGMLSDLGLRYNLTVPLARVYAAHQGKVPAVFRCYQIQPVWRADTPGKGRFREFYQCDADVVGSDSRSVETELLAASSECLKGLGFDEFKLRLNHRGLLRAIVELCGIPSECEIDAIIAIDKLDKAGRDGVDAELSRKGIAAESRKQLLDMIAERASLERIATSVKKSDLGRAAAEDVRSVVDFCKATPAADHLVFDISLARGLDYYTGCIYEAEAPGLASSLGGGGRYDELVGSFLGKPVPACGFSLGLERILGVMDEQNLFPGLPAPVDAVVAAVADDGLEAALGLASRLRSAGLKVELSTRPYKPGKLRKYADGRGLPFAVWLEPGAEDEASLWKKADGSIQSGLSFDNLVEVLGITAQNR